MKAPQEKVQITVDFDPATGAVRLNAPLQNRVLCYGLLQMAMEIIAKQDNKAPKPSSIVVPQIKIGPNGL